MLTVFRRHRKNCPYRGTLEVRVYVGGDLFVRKGKCNCSCSLWVDGVLAGREIRKSLGTRDWQKAIDIVREMIKPRSEPQGILEPITIEQAGENFLAEVKSRRLSECTIYKYKLLFKRLNDFAGREGLRYLKELNLPTLDTFRSEWTEGPRSSLKKIERLRGFLRFCERRRWIDTNPATELTPPKVPNRPTLPFTHEEMLQILAALDDYEKRAGRAQAQRVRAFVLLLRYSGMRIGDAVQCGPERVNGNKLFLYTQKTGVPVRCVLPDFVVQAIEAVPKSSDRFFFWTGRSKLHTAVGIWQQSLQTLFSLAGVRGGHAHRLRDTFAVELLLSGVPLERVSVLLGHQSIRVTERHYAPWTRSRQQQLEADLQRAWNEDPVALIQSQGTLQVHEPKSRN